MASSRIEGDGAIGAQGVGYVALMPCLTNDLPCVFFTNNLFNHDTLYMVNTAGVLRNGVVTANVNSPYVSSQLVAGASYDNTALDGRVVVASLRVSYTGPLLSTSGLTTGYVNPRHSSIESVRTGTGTGFAHPGISYFQSMQESSICPFSPKPCTISMGAALPHEYGFGGTVGDNLDQAATLAGYPYSNGDNLFNLVDGGNPFVVNGIAVGVPTAVMMMSGQPGVSFHFSVILHCEVVGQAAAPSYTPSLANPGEAQKIYSAAAGIPAMIRADPQETPWTALRSIMISSAKALAPIIVPFVETAVRLAL